MTNFSSIDADNNPTAEAGKAHDVRIRKADARESRLLSQLIREAYRDVAERFNLTPENCPKHPSNCRADWIKNDCRRGVVYYILECAGTPVACAAIEKADPGHCYLERLAVTPPYRHNGFGQALVEHILAQAQAWEMRSVGIGIIAQQTELKSWYRNLGFVESGTREFAHLPFLVAFMTYTLAGDGGKR